MIWALVAVAAIAAAYQIVAIIACLKHLAPVKKVTGPLQGVSILKPVYRRMPGFDEAVRSHRAQSYPEFELLIGSGNDRAQLNGKVGNLIALAEQARYPILIVNDADIVVPQNYIRDVTAPLADPQTGVVTCLYRAVGNSWPARFEALGVATDFAPSALVAPLAGVSEFGFGSTLTFRRADLDQIGGFQAVADYLADDYQIGARIHRLGRINRISQVVVTTRLHTDNWGAVWRHQLRWARTIRLSRLDGYLGLPVTFATLWALVAALCGAWGIAAGVMVVRMGMAITAGWFVLRSPDVLRLFWLVPLRDLYGVAVWAAGLFGNRVEWGGEILTLDRQGRIIHKRHVGPL